MTSTSMHTSVKGARRTSTSKAQQGDPNSPLDAVQRLRELLTEEVIPRLAGDRKAEEALPAGVAQALQDCYRTQSAEQADALAALFGALEEQHEASAEPQAAALAGTRAPAARAINIRPGVRVGPTGKLLLRVLEGYPKKGEIYITSAYRPEEKGSHHGGLSYRGSPTAAIDIGAGGVNPAGSRRMRDVAKWLYDRFAADTVELIHTTPYNTDRGFYVKNQRKYPAADRTCHHPRTASRPRPLRKVQGIGAEDPCALRQPGNARARSRSGMGLGRERPRLETRADGSRRRAQGSASLSLRTSAVKAAPSRPEYKQGLERARAARIPVLGAYHVLWPGKPREQARVFFNVVNKKTPWWKNVPWIWQLDAEKFESMPRAPSPAEGKQFLDELKRLAGGKGYFIAYAPRWVYEDTFKIGYDLWASDYTGSGAPRPFKQQYKGVPASSWRPYSGRKPRILQFASDAMIGAQKTCDANRFDGDLNELIRLTGHRPRAGISATRSVLEPEHESLVADEAVADTSETCAAPDTDENRAVDSFARDIEARGYPHQPCRPGGPTPADKAVVAKIGGKLRGKLRGALNGQRICCARQIVAGVQARRMHKRAAVIAVTTAIVESTLLNINRELDHDSLGLFQQRASWGSRAQRLNPRWATNAFVNAMLRKLPGNAWMRWPIGKVCQKVQVSAYPNRYQHEAADAAIIVGALWGAGKAARAVSARDALRPAPAAELEESLQALIAAIGGRQRESRARAGNSSSAM